MENTKTEATKKAKALAKKMGKEWEIKVWENLGWHYSVHLKNSIYVIPCYKLHPLPRYYVMVGEHGSMLCMFAPEHKEYEDPILAVKETLKAYNDKMKKFGAEQEAIVNVGLDYLGLETA